MSTAEDVFKKICKKEAKAGSWMICKLDKKKIAVAAEGEGIESFKKTFEDDKCMWGVINVHGVDVLANVESTRTKLVQINWVGADVPSMKKMHALAGKQKVSKICRGIAEYLDCTSIDDITTKEIVAKLSASGGSHKPTYYNFGDGEKVNLEFYDPANK